MAEAESLSVEETNKLRLSLGLKPLNVGNENVGASKDATAYVDQERIAADNFRERWKSEEKSKRERETKERLSKARDRVYRAKRLTGKTLAEDNEDEETLVWIRRTKNVPAQNTSSRTQARPITGGSEYTSEHLQGLKVTHNLDDIENGEEIILTLNDSGVLDDAPDELSNIELNTKRALETKLNSKKRKSIYAAYEDDNVAEFNGEKRILARYDDGFDGAIKKDAGFRIDSLENDGVQAIARSIEPRQQTMISLDTLYSAQPASSDYAEPVKMKKPKKRNASRKIRASTPDQPVRETPNAVHRVVLQDNLVDEDDLQASLAIQRRLAQQKRAKFRAEQVVERVKTEAESAMETEASSNLDDRLILDETTEFINGLQDIKILSPKLKKETSSGNMNIKQEQAVTSLSETPEFVTPWLEQDQPPNTMSTTGLEEEAAVDQGVGVALALLRRKGVLQENQAQTKQRNEQEAWLAESKRLRLQYELERRRVREELRDSPTFKNMSAHEREAHAARENRRLDALQAKAEQERFKSYKPNIEIKHVDDFGRTMTPKETFKLMSHQFHGKDSGSGKTAKKLAQIGKEKALEQKSLFK